MTAFSGYLAPGTALVDGVLAELPGLARQPAGGDADGDAVTLAAGVTFGPFQAAVGPLGAVAIFSAAAGGTMLFSATLSGLSVGAGQCLTFPAGAYTMQPGGTPGADVVLLGGTPLLAGGQPVQLT